MKKELSCAPRLSVSVKRDVFPANWVIYVRTIDLSIYKNSTWMSVCVACECACVYEAALPGSSSVFTLSSLFITYFQGNNQSSALKKLLLIVCF